ncbi:polyketide cyclase [Nocardioides sp. zg-536]|uniref:Polyketide cyclase n=1 Tax=Nocardioides faecalis TaxID=2803858 RepID=A0A938Y410_9ACTN|nr:polyketide cyclase [Nocardioides faecalis]MBM9459588.1 polyketide cyclase [Nocardioides faecalis]QVI58114.1 polyketide cyclase [Nocardioides faecalis]
MTEQVGPVVERIEASRFVPAGVPAILAVLRDPDGHVAVDASGMLQSADGTVVRAVGDDFVVHMDREALGDLPMGRYDVRVIITAFDEPASPQWTARVEWTIEGMVRPPIGHVFGHVLEPVDEGTRVTSYCDWSGAREEWKPIFPVIDAKALRASLGLLERAVLRGYPRPLVG